MRPSAEVSRAARPVKQHDLFRFEAAHGGPGGSLPLLELLSHSIADGEMAQGLRVPKGSGSVAQGLSHTSTVVPQRQGLSPILQMSKLYGLWVSRPSLPALWAFHPSEYAPA